MASHDTASGLAKPIRAAEELAFRWASNFSSWEDRLWDAYVFHTSDRHVFKKREIHDRLIAFGAYMCAWMVVLGILSVLAVAKREHGSVREAFKVWKSMKRHELVQIVVEGKRYDQLDEESDSENEDVVPKAKQRGRCCCCRPTTADLEDEPPVTLPTKASAAAMEKDKQRMETLKKKLEASKQKDGERPDDVEKELEELKEISKLRAEDKKKGASASRLSLDSPPQEAEREMLLKLQVEELRGEQAAVPCIQRSKVGVSVLLFVGYVLICTGIPFFAAGQASCKQGLPWEYHMPFFHYFIVVKLWEVCLLAFDTSIPGRIGLRTFAIKFSCSFLAFFDGYSDSNAILIAHVCGSNLWHWMAACYAIGVVLLQWVFLGTLSLCLDTSNTCFFKMLHMDSLAECSAMKPGEKHALTAWRLVNIFRFTFEDLPQSVIQIVFIVTVNRNYIMMGSVFVGVCTSAKAIYDAFKRAAAAMGTNFEYLRAVSDMQAAMEREDPKAFFEAYEIAEASGANKDSLQERLAQAEEKFGFISAQKVPRMMIGMDRTEAPEQLVRALQNTVPEDAYSHRRRTVNWAAREARERTRELKAREGSSSAAAIAGYYHEGRHSWRLYRSQRRTVDFAIKAEQEREKRLQGLIRAGPVDCCCLGSRPKNAGEVADAKCGLGLGK